MTYAWRLFKVHRCTWINFENQQCQQQHQQKTNKKTNEQMGLPVR